MDKNVLTSNDIKLLSQNLSVENKGNTARKVTAYYEGGQITEKGLKLAEDIFRIMVEDIEVKVREILSDSLKNCKSIPRDIAFKLINDQASVAVPFIKHYANLTREDLMSIAYYHHNGREYNEEIMPEDYAPIPKDPLELGEEISWKIREAAAKELQQAETGAVPEAEAEGMSVEKYYGTYNGSVAVIIGQSYYSYPAVEINSWDTIGGVVIHYWSYDRIQIWREN